MKLSEKEVDAEVQAMRQWVDKQPHLPGDTIDDNLLRRFLHSCDHSVERAKSVLELFCTLRTAAPEFFSQRDPLQPNVQQAFDVVDVIPLPKRTPDDYQLFLYRLHDPDPDKLNYNDYVKMLLLVADVRMITETSLPEGDVPIFDLGGITLRHLTRVVLPSLRKYMQYFQEAHPVRLKQIHIINVPPIIDKVMALVKPFTRREVNSMMHYHSVGGNTLYDFVPRELLPNEYGGGQGRCTDLKNMWKNKVIANRDFFLNERSWKTDESKRSSASASGARGGCAPAFGMEGSFRSLAID